MFLFSHITLLSNFACTLRRHLAISGSPSKGGTAFFFVRAFSPFCLVLVTAGPCLTFQMASKTATPFIPTAESQVWHICSGPGSSAISMHPGISRGLVLLGSALPQVAQNLIPGHAAKPHLLHRSTFSHKIPSTDYRGQFNYGFHYGYLYTKVPSK